MTAARAPESSGADRFLNRELSWLDFNGRILDLAEDAQLPILERVKFCAICSSHLDEFFMVRVAGLTGQAASGAAVRSVDGLTPHAALAVIRERTLELIARQSSLWTDQLQPALADHGILVGRIEDCTDEELAELGRRFEREVFPVLTPLAVSPGQPFPYISPLSLSLGILVRDPKTAEERFARVKVPELLPRFVTLDGRTLLLPLEHVIRHFLAWLFPRMEVIECAAFRVTRDADFEVSDEADDLLEAVELELRRRRFGGVVRLETSASMSSRMLEQLRRGLGVTADQVYPVSGLLDLADLSEIAELDFPELREAPWLPITQPKLSSVAGTSDFFAEIARQDILVHHPYESFTTSFEAFVRAAAADPDVVGLKTTVYRTGDESPLVPALIEAAEDGKQSVCLIELKARGDESRNIEWSRALERAGVHVSYGFPNRKIHAKATLVVRREGDALRRYVHLGTGNYNAATARIYEDFGLFTADEDIASDVADLFNYLTGFGSPRRFRKLWIAPFTLRERLIDEIRAVAEAAAGGRPGRIRLKVNALTDVAIIDALYDASQAGAEIDIVTRSICSLRPGVPGSSENIRVRSIVGRFLEHSRVFILETDDRATYVMTSADLMPRNLDHRLEIAAPVEHPALQRRLSDVLDVLLADNSQAWKLGADGTWERLRPGKKDAARASQATLMKKARTRPRRRTATKRGR
ncbi:MAG: polyphosphate kinase 1 [Actinobacteria bacterium]|nr:polyphosphate kinase 1 [Actinomycetota bacterium]